MSGEKASRKDNSTMEAVLNDEDVLLTVTEVARRLRVDDTTVRRWIKVGALKAVVLPHANERQAYRIKLSTLKDLLNA